MGEKRVYLNVQVFLCMMFSMFISRLILMCMSRLILMLISRLNSLFISRLDLMFIARLSSMCFQSFVRCLFQGQVQRLLQGLVQLGELTFSAQMYGYMGSHSLVLRGNHLSTEKKQEVIRSYYLWLPGQVKVWVVFLFETRISYRYLYL